MGREWQWCGSLAGAGDHQEVSSTTSGCMSGMLHYFDFHHLLLFAGGGSAAGSRRHPPDPQPSSRSPATHCAFEQLNGLEAPRNSLELDERKAISASVIDEEFSDIPVAIEVFPTPASSTKNTSKKNMLMLFDEERKTSSQTETPRTANIVARLMGLEVLLEGASTSPASAKGTKTQTRHQSMVAQKQQQPQKKSSKKTINFTGDQKPASSRQPLQSLNCNISGSRSLPESPRASVSRSCDGDPVLSIQMNKENSYNYKIVHDSNSLPTSPSTITAIFRRKQRSIKHQDDSKCLKNNSVGEQIAKAVKDRIASAGDHETGAKSKRTPAEKKVFCESNAINPPSSSSARTQIRFFEAQMSKENSHDRVLKPAPMPKPPLSISSQLKEPAKDRSSLKKEKAVVAPKKCMKASNERFTERIKKPSSYSLPTLASVFQSPSSCSSTAAALHDQKQVSKNLKWTSNPPTVTSSERKEASASPISRQATQEPILANRSCLRSSKIPMIDELGPDLPEYKYVKAILDHADPMFRWHSTSLPIDPIIFYEIELKIEFDEKKDRCELLRGTMQYKWNRKLLFHLIEELLGDFLIARSPNLPAPPTPVIRERKQLCFLWHESGHRNSSGSATAVAAAGEEPWLLRWLWRRIRGFPAANCRVIGDIDALVAGDLAEANTRRLLLHPAVADEAQHVVAAVELEILHELLDDATVLLMLAGSGDTTRASSGRRSFGDRRPMITRT